MFAVLGNESCVTADREFAGYREVEVEISSSFDPRVEAADVLEQRASVDRASGEPRPVGAHQLLVLVLLDWRLIVRVEWPVVEGRTAKGPDRGRALGPALERP